MNASLSWALPQLPGPKLAAEDIHRVVTSLPKDLVAEIKARGAVIVGGLIRAKIAGETVNDIDLFAASEPAAQGLADAIVRAYGASARMFRTRNAYTVLAHPRVPVQVIHRWTYSNPEDLVASFDFTVAQAAIWWHPSGKWQSLCSPDFYRDLAGRRLRYTFPARNEDAGGSILRVQKFLGRGYHISPEQLGNVIARLVSGVKPGTKFWDEGEQEKGKVLAGMLRHVDPLTVVDGLEPDNDSMETPAPADPVEGA